jgi:polyisoprenoid-binding protein YceI
MKRALYFLGFLALLGSTEVQAQAPLYKIIPDKSSMLVHTDVSGLFKKFGRQLEIEVREFSGEFRFNPNSEKECSLKFDAKTHSLALKTRVSDQDRENIEVRMHERMLQTEQYPDIRYESEKVQIWKVGDKRYDVEVLGRLSLHGYSSFLPLRAQLTLKDGKIEAAGMATLKQTDFKIKPYSYQGGALKVADEVKLSFQMLAERL